MWKREGVFVLRKGNIREVVVLRWARWNIIGRCQWEEGRSLSVGVLMLWGVGKEGEGLGRGLVIR